MIELDRKEFDRLMLNFEGSHQIRDINDDNTEYDFFTEYGGSKVMVFKVKCIGTSDKIMDGDIVLTASRGLRRVQIQGGHGTYAQSGGKCINIAISNTGYMYNALHEGTHPDDCYRARWNTCRVVKRACPWYWGEK